MLNRFKSSDLTFISPVGPNILKITPINSSSVEVEGDIVTPEHIEVNRYVYKVEDEYIPKCVTTNSKRKCIISYLRPFKSYKICAYGLTRYEWRSENTSCMTVTTPQVGKYKYF